MLSELSAGLLGISKEVSGETYLLGAFVWVCSANPSLEARSSEGFERLMVAKSKAC